MWRDGHTAGRNQSNESFLVTKVLNTDLLLVPLKRTKGSPPKTNADGGSDFRITHKVIVSLPISLPTRSLAQSDHMSGGGGQMIRHCRKIRVKNKKIYILKIEKGQPRF